MTETKEKSKTKIIEIGPKELDQLFKDEYEYQRILEELIKGKDPFNRTSKASGGSIGSLMDKDLRQPIPMLRIHMEDGGMTRDQQIEFHLWLANMRPTEGQGIWAVESARNWLEKNLTEAEKRIFNYPR